MGDGRLYDRAANVPGPLKPLWHVDGERSRSSGRSATTPRIVTASRFISPGFMNGSVCA